MRMDAEKWAFSAVAQDGTLALVDTSDCFQVGILVDIDSIAGTPTNCRALAVAETDQTLGSATEHIRKTADITAAGEYFLGQRGSAVGEVAFENVYPKIRIIADFTGGTAPTMTGSIYVFRKRMRV